MYDSVPSVLTGYEPQNLSSYLTKAIPKKFVIKSNLGHKIIAFNMSVLAFIKSKDLGVWNNIDGRC